MLMSTRKRPSSSGRWSGSKWNEPWFQREEVVDGLLDLHLDVALELLLLDGLHLDEDLAEPPPPGRGLPLHRLGEDLAGHHVVADQKLAQAVGPVQHRRVDDPAVLEVDVAEVGPVGDAQAPGLAAHPQQLADVREVDVLEAAFDGHHSSSSCSSSSTRGQCSTTFSAEGNQPDPTGGGGFRCRHGLRGLPPPPTSPTARRCPRRARPAPRSRISSNGGTTRSRAGGRRLVAHSPSPPRAPPPPPTQLTRALARIHLQHQTAFEAGAERSSIWRSRWAPVGGEQPGPPGASGPRRDGRTRPGRARSRRAPRRRAPGGGPGSTSAPSTRPPRPLPARGYWPGL